MQSALYRRYLLPALQRLMLGIAFASGAMPSANPVRRLKPRPVTDVPEVPVIRRAA